MRQRISVETGAMGKTVYLIDDDEEGGTVINSWLLPTNSAHHGQTCPEPIARAMVEYIEEVQKPLFDGLGDAIKSHVRAGVGWVAKEVIR